MKVQTISKAAAFSPGKHTWFLPDLKQSKWTRKVDWYLNFIISRAHKHTARNFDEKLNEILSDNDLPIEPVPIKANAPYLFGSSTRLPNDQTVVLQYHGNINTWVEEIHKIWSDLKQPACRIFLPIDLSADEFKKHWPNSESAELIEVVVFEN